MMFLGVLHVRKPLSVRSPAAGRESEPSGVSPLGTYFVGIDARWCPSSLANLVYGIIVQKSRYMVLQYKRLWYYSTKVTVV